VPLQAAFERDDGTPNAPGDNSPWSDWVAASKTRNYCADDPLLDWLNAFGESKGFKSDDQLSDYDRRTDFRAFIFERAAQFEQTVIEHLANRFVVLWVARERSDIQSRASIEATWDAMHGGVEIIAQGVLWNAQTQTYGAPDLLVRSDILHSLFPDDISAAEAQVGTSDLPFANLHYRVVDVKFTTLDLLKDGHAGSSHLHHMAQVWLYDEALARLQGLAPRAAFLLGRRWKDSKGRGQSALERLARVNTDTYFQTRELDLRELSLSACDWIRRMRAKGSEWEVLPEPSVPELRPNMRHGDDQPWHHAKAYIARQLQDLTLLPRVTPERRSQALASGLTHWTDARCTAALLGITGDKNPIVLNAVIRANHSDGGGPVVFPSRLNANQGCWREREPGVLA
jgi:hypothetical protein